MLKFWKIKKSFATITKNQLFMYLCICYYNFIIEKNAATQEKEKKFRYFSKIWI